jgi:nucleoid DNA-binding protein
MAILPNLTQQVADQQALIEALQAKLAIANQPKRMTMKVSEKGALSIYGLGRFPVTLYRGQWERLLAAKTDIEAFITTNATLLAVKD